MVSFLFVFNHMHNQMCESDIHMVVFHMKKKRTSLSVLEKKGNSKFLLKVEESVSQSDYEEFANDLF